MSTKILIVDDEEDIRNLIQGILSDEGYETQGCSTSTQTYEAIETAPPALVILDIWIQGSAHDGLEILKNLHKNHPKIPVLMISGHGTIETAVAAIKDGAYDFIEKPFKSDRLLLMIQRALETMALKQENESLRRQTSTSDILELLGDSPVIEKLRQVVERVAPTNSRVFLTGEPGTGKNIVARLLHQHSERAEQPYLIVNCATLHPEHLESELFGSTEPGQQSTGLLEQANGGTLLLDEIADMSLETQAKIVRVLQEQRFQKTGASDFIEVDVRIFSTTNKNIEQLIESGRFREDLYYRLNVVPLHMPALRERRGDVEALAESFLELVGPSFGVEGACFNDLALQKLKAYDWPGNIRQLKNIVEWVLIMHADHNEKAFSTEHLPPDITGRAVSQDSPESETMEAMLECYCAGLPLREARELFEREYLLSQVKRFEGNISKTAQFVGMERSALHRKLKNLGLNEDKTHDATQAKTIRKRA